MDDYNSIKNWMSSHDMHSHGIVYDDIDLEDEMLDLLEEPVDTESTDNMEDMLDEARELAAMCVADLSKDEACGCAMIFGKTINPSNSVEKGCSLEESQINKIKGRLSKQFQEFVQEYPQLSTSEILKTLFSENVLERCERTYKAVFTSKNKNK